MSLEETVKKMPHKRLMEDAHPAVLSGTKPGTRPEGVGTEPVERHVERQMGVFRQPLGVPLTSHSFHRGHAQQLVAVDRVDDHFFDFSTTKYPQIYIDPCPA